MKATRQAFEAIIVLTLCGALAACGGSQKSQNTQTTTSKTTSSDVSQSMAQPEGSPYAPAAQPANGTPPQPMPQNMHCNADQIVWVNTHTHVYHYANDQYYGRTKQGKYLCVADARAEGDRAPSHRRRNAVPLHSQSQAMSPAPEGDETP